MKACTINSNLSLKNNTGIRFARSGAPFLGLLLLCACAMRNLPQPDHCQRPGTGLRTLRGYYKSHFLGEQNQVRWKGTFAVDDRGRWRLEGLGPLGQSQWVLTFDGENLHFRSSTHPTVLSTSVPAVVSVMPAFGFALPIREFATLILAVPRMEKDPHGSRFAWLPDAESNLLRSVRWTKPGSEESITLEYLSYTIVNDRSIPQSLRITSSENQSVWLLKLLNCLPDLPIEEEILDLRQPGRELKRLSWKVFWESMMAMGGDRE